MKYVFFGTPEFAAIILRKLIDASFFPIAVVCNPDRPAGRKKVITKPPAKIIAEKHHIPVLQPEKLDLGFVLHLSSFKPDFSIVAAYAKILPKDCVEMPRLGTIGVHPSLLPKYRGASPIQSAILNGETETGVALYLLDEKMDHGPMLKNGKLKIENSDTYETLMRKLAELGGDLLAETIPKFLAGEIKPQAQDEREATFTKKFTTEDGRVDAHDLEAALTGEDRKKAVRIERKIRALNPEPGAWTIQNGKRVKLLFAEIENGKLKLKKIQTEGKKPITLKNGK